MHFSNPKASQAFTLVTWCTMFSFLSYDSVVNSSNAMEKLLRLKISNQIISSLALMVQMWDQRWLERHGQGSCRVKTQLQVHDNPSLRTFAKTHLFRGIYCTLLAWVTQKRQIHVFTLVFAFSGFILEMIFAQSICTIICRVCICETQICSEAWEKTTQNIEMWWWP